MLVRNGVSRAIPRVTPSFPPCIGGRHYGTKKRIEKKIKTDGKDQPSQTTKFRPVRSDDHPILLDIPVPLELPIFSPELVSQETVASAMYYPSVKLNSYPHHVYGVPKNIENEFALATRPFSIIRQSTLNLLRLIDNSMNQSSEASRYVLTGVSGCGKSHLLLQGVTYCALNGWIVLYVPRSINLVNSTTPYLYDPRTQTYLQLAASSDLLRKLMTLNSSKLKKIKTSREFITPALDIPDARAAPPTKLPLGENLETVVSVGIRDQPLASFVLDWVLEELSIQTEFPVLVAIDDFQALYKTSAYRDPQFVPIKGYHLSLPRLLLEYCSGKKILSRGLTLGAISTTHTSFLPPIELLEGIDAASSATKYSLAVSAFGPQPSSPTSLLPRPVAPLAKRSTALQTYAKGLKNLEVPYGFSVQEAMTLFEVWVNEKVLHTTPSDQFFLTKYSEANGNPREFVWKGLMGTLDS